MNILITGGSGFFGMHFAKAMCERSDTERIVIYSRGEARQADMRMGMPHGKLRWMIGDVRDRDRLQRAMHGIDVVVHAAALKRIEVGNYNPDEMVKTNVHGTMNVIDAAIAERVQRVVYLSTDKAYQPVSPYGCTKALGEHLMLNANNLAGKDGPKFSVVRYGNVAGSTGSVIPVWKALHALGMKCPVTDPDCTRFYMSVKQTITLITHVLGHMAHGAVFDQPVIPSLRAYRLGDLASAMGVALDTPSGLPRYEKKHESMNADQCSETAPRMMADELRAQLIQDGLL